MFSRQSTSHLFWLVMVIAILHHVDHILRIDHSGWPFLTQTSPFTYSLIAYPILSSIYLAHNKPRYRVVAAAVLFLFATTAHIFFEPLTDKYHTWTYGSNLPNHVGEQNLLGVRSPVLGIASIALAVALSVVLLLLLLALVKDAKQSEHRLLNSKAASSNKLVN